MRFSLILFFRLGVVLAVFFLFSERGLAQGCGLGIVTELVPCYKDKNGKVTDTDDQTCQGGGAGASPCMYCYEGSGYCPDTGVSYSTANLGIDEGCPNCVPPSCCNGGLTCGKAEKCVGCNCEHVSPIIVDTTGKGFHLTAADDGVMFDMAGDGHPFKVAWTTADSGNAFLALDRNHDGRINSGKELFGNFTAQLKSDEPNGFLALAEFDKPENGGNGDGIIDRRDAVFSRLLLWIDENHDGISQPNELHSLPELGVFSLALHYRNDQHFYDQYGNWFHYQATVNPDPRDGESKDGRVTFDVFFVVAHNESTGSSAQSHRPHDRLNQWELSLADDVAFALRQARKSGCRPQSQQDRSGGTQ